MPTAKTVAPAGRPSKTNVPAGQREGRRHPPPPLRLHRHDPRRPRAPPSHSMGRRPTEATLGGTGRSSWACPSANSLLACGRTKYNITIKQFIYCYSQVYLFIFQLFFLNGKIFYGWFVFGGWYSTVKEMTSIYKLVINYHTLQFTFNVIDTFTPDDQCKQEIYWLFRYRHIFLNNL